MKIREISIQQYGAWQDLNLPLGESDFNLFYGPNEAGKTTLMRFIRGALYGYKPFHEQSRASEDRREEWDGALLVDVNDEPLKIRRRWRDDSRGKVTIKPNHSAESDQYLLRSLLNGIDESVFEHVYALGLEELQSLATLNRDEVAEQIYGMSLGPEGEVLRLIAGDIANRKKYLLSSDGTSGQIGLFLDRQDQIQKEISLLNVPLHQYQQLGGEQKGLQSNIDQLKQEQNRLETELRGCRYMEKVFDPWKQVQEYKRELRSLSSLKKFPANGLAQLRSLDKDLNNLTRERDELLSQSGSNNQQAGRFINDDNLLKHEPAIRSLYQMSDWFTEIKQDGDKAGLEYDSYRNSLSRMVTGWGDDWSLERFDNVKVSPENHYQLLKSAQAYQSALGRWGRLRKRYKSRVKSTKQREAELEEKLKGLGGLSVDAALGQAKQHLIDLEELGALQLREADLASREQNLHERLTLMEEYQEIPQWVQTVIWVFGILGVVFFLWGMIEWFSDDAKSWNYRAIAGAVYAMVGLMTGGIAWGMKNQYGRGDGDSIEQYRFQFSQIETELRQTREQISRLTAGGAYGAGQYSSSLVQPQSLSNQPASTLIQNATRNVAGLEELYLLEDRVKGDRRKLSELRGRFKTMQQKVSDARQNWCALLRQLGLTETVKINDAFQNWQGLLEADELKQNLGYIKREQDVHDRIWDSICNRIGQVAQQIGDRQYDANQPIQAITDWNDRLSQLDRQQSERDRLQGDVERLQYRISELETAIATLLSQGGASTRKEFKERAGSLSRCSELQELLTMAEQELQEIASQEQELAIVEDDLKRYNPHDNASRITELTREQAEIERQLQQEFQSLGSLEQKLKALEEDRRWSRLRLERAQVREQLGQGLEDFLGLQLAEQSMQKAQVTFEKNHQPEILVRASKYLSSLTEKKHRNIWTPLGKQRLSVDDKKGNSLQVEELSSGTREQLFLAIRLALVDRYREQGVQLPMVLDDILVNFDQARTEAAVDTLSDYANNNGQQVLFFTCHQHLADLFNRKGGESIRLPKIQRRGQSSESGSLSSSSLSSASHPSRSSSDSNRDRSRSERTGRTVTPETSSSDRSSENESSRSSLTDRSSRTSDSNRDSQSSRERDSSSSRRSSRSSSSSQRSSSHRSGGSGSGSGSGSGIGSGSGSRRSSRSYSRSSDGDRDSNDERSRTRRSNRDYDRQYERGERTKIHSEQKRAKKLKWYLNRNDPVVDAPSIGPKTAKRLKKYNIKTVDDLLKADAKDLADQLDTKHIKAETIREWQQQAKLICRIPQIRGHDSQILVAVGMTKPKEIAAMSPVELLAIVEPFIETSAGSRIIRNGKKPDLEEVTDWIEWAKSARLLIDA